MILKFLVKKSKPLCLHTLLTYSWKRSGTVKTTEEKIKIPKLNRELTVKEVVHNIRKSIPKMTEIPGSKFLKDSRKFTEELVSSPDRSSLIEEHIVLNCLYCLETLIDWMPKTKPSFLLAMGHAAEIDMKAKFCKKCRRLYYPGIYYNTINSSVSYL